MRGRAARRLEDTARAAAALGVIQVNGFLGSPIWPLLYSFPPNDFEVIERGYEEVARRLQPILEVFEREGVRFGLEVHPTEIAYDFVTTQKTLAALGNRESFGINLDPSHFIPQFLDPALYAREFAPRIYHVHVKDAKRRLDGRRSILASHLPFSDRARGWDFVSPGHGDVDFDELFRTLNEIGYTGPLSVEWEDSGMDRERGAAEALGLPSAGPRSRRRPSPSTRQCSGTENREDPAAADSPVRRPRPGRQAGCSSRSADNSRGARAFIRRRACQAASRW